MSRQSELNSYIQHLRGRLRLGATVRGAAILTATALGTTLVLVLVLNALAFPEHDLTRARILLGAALVAVAAAFLWWPLTRLTRRRAITDAEAIRPEFEQRLVTFEERQEQGDPFIELLAADTLSVADDATPKMLVPDNRLLALAGAGVACVAVLAWMVFAGPGYLGYGASLLWTGPKKNVAPLYEVRVTPGDVAVRRNSDQLVTAQVIGLIPDKVQLFARYKSVLEKVGKDGGGWEPVAMQPDTMAGQAHFQFLLTGLPEDVEYYVQAGPIKSNQYKVRVVDLPGVKHIHVTYHFPKWTGMKDVTEERSGDLRAIEGTKADLQVEMDHPLKDGMLVLDDGQQLKLAPGSGNLYKGTVEMAKDGAYHVAGVDQGQQVRLSEDYFISTNKANPPTIAIDKPGQDYRASPIEEVKVGVRAADDFGLRSVALHYSVNGGPEKTVNMLKKPGDKDSNGSTVLSLEDFKLVPGDLVSLYATAVDGHADARTDMMFIQADPFEREFSQSQQGGGGGGGGGGQRGGNQTDISRREKELISETFNRANTKGATAKETADAGQFLSDVQLKLKQEVQSLQVRMQSRDLSSANEEFNSFDKDMQQASEAMTPSAGKLKQLQWKDAIPMEQKALQYLLRAEATFRQIEVAFGRQGGGGGGGGGGAGRDLASLFDLELDTEKNQYETASTGSAEQQRAQQVDEALQRLDALAHRQEELAQQQRSGQQTFQERWQQEMLRREAEQLQRDMEQMAQNQQGQPGGQSSQSSSSQSSQSSQGGQQSQNGQQGQSSQQQNAQNSRGQQSGQQQSGQQQTGQQRANNNSNGGVDPRVQQALNRLRDANDQMSRNGGQKQQGSGADAAQRAADQLRQAKDLLTGTSQQQAGNQVGQMAREAGRLGQEEKAQSQRIQDFATQSSQQRAQAGLTTQQQYQQRMQELNKITNDRQQLSDDLEKLERNMRDTARQMASTQPGTSSKLRDALSGVDQEDLRNLMQRSADLLRQGYNPNSNGTEANISNGLQKLQQQLQQTEQAANAGQGGKQQPGQGQGRDGQSQQAALDHLERLRNQIQTLSAGNRSGQQQGQNGQQQGRNGQPGQNDQQQGQGQQGQGQQGSQQARNGQQGQNGQQQGRNGRQGQQGQGQQGQGQQQEQGQQQAQNGQRGQQGQGQQGQGGQQGQQGQGQQRGQGQQGQGGQQGGQGGQQQANGGQRGVGQQNGQLSRNGNQNPQPGQTNGGRYGNPNDGRVIDGGHGGAGDVWNNVDTGGQTFTKVNTPQGQTTPQGDPQASFRQSMNELSQLHHLAQDDPQLSKDVAALEEEMKKLDPARFKGNPEMVESLHTRVLGEVDKLELQLRRNDQQASGQVRTSKPAQVPPGYQEAVAEYFRRLSKGQQ